MKFLYEKKTIVSEKNGPITIQWVLGILAVLARGRQQSGPYVRAIWKQALRELPSDLQVRNVLILGLAGGCLVKLLEERFPGVHIVAIEWDPVMVDITRELKQCKTMPEVHVGDVHTIVPALTQHFDLIANDAFEGSELDESLDEVFSQAFPRLLAPKGNLLVNICGTMSITPALKKYMHLEKEWDYKEGNRLARFTVPSGKN